MSTPRADISAHDKSSRRDVVAALDRRHDELRAANPDFTEEDWDRLAEEWADDVKEGLREHVRRHNEEFERRTRFSSETSEGAGAACVRPAP